MRLVKILTMLVLAGGWVHDAPGSIVFQESPSGSGDLVISISQPIIFNTVGSGSNSLMGMAIQDLYATPKGSQTITSSGLATTSSLSILSSGASSTTPYDVRTINFRDVDSNDLVIGWTFGTNAPFTAGDTVTVSPGSITVFGKFAELGDINPGPKSVFFFRYGGVGTGPDSWEINSDLASVNAVVPEPSHVLLSLVGGMGLLMRRRRNSVG